MCYMSVLCYTSVICLVLGGVVGLGYILSNAYLCNHMLLQSGGGTWDKFCTLLEVWVLGVGMSTLGAQTALYAEYRGLQVPMTLEHDPVTSISKSAPGSDLRISHRIQIGMFRPIRVDHTNCLQVSIKTHSFIRDLHRPWQATLMTGSKVDDTCVKKLIFIPVYYFPVHIMLFPHARGPRTWNTETCKNKLATIDRARHKYIEFICNLHRVQEISILY
jgi:hypothetical protein